MGLISWIMMVFLVPSAQAEVVVPFSKGVGIFGAGEITVPCQVNGVEFQKCKVDTGAGFTSVKKRLELPIGPVINTVPVISFSGAAGFCDVAVENTVSFGDVSVSNSLLLVCPDVSATGADVILGLDVLSTSTLRFDFVKNEIVLGASGTSQETPWTEDPTGHVLLPISLGNKNPVAARAMFDSGAALTAVDIAFVDAHPDLFTIIQDNSIKDTHGNVIVSKLVIASTLNVGQEKFIAEYMMAVDLTESKKLTGDDVVMILGYNVISTTHWWFDFKSNSWSNGAGAR